MIKFFLLMSAVSVVFGLASLDSASAVTIRSAKLDAAGENLIVDVSFGGGCETPKIELEMKGCAESSPVQCQATVKNMVLDFCEMMLSQTVVFNLKTHGIEGRYYSNGSLTLKGSDGSSATVQLPNFSGGTASSPGSALPGGAAPAYPEKIVCVTHTGSDLEINPAKREATLISVTGEARTYSITHTDRALYERLPPIDQRTYTLDDGRKIVIQTGFGEKVGTGHFIRTTGDSSPDFKSCLVTR